MARVRFRVKNRRKTRRGGREKGKKGGKKWEEGFSLHEKLKNPKRHALQLMRTAF